jgi:hypothetical protein
MKNISFSAVAAVVGVLLASSASATPFSFSDNFAGGVSGAWNISVGTNSAAAGILGQLSAGTATLTLNPGGVSAANGALLEFDLLQFRSVDGVNCCTDVFNIVVNGSTIYSASLNGPGGGTTQINSDPNGATVTGAAGSYHIKIPFSIIAGNNTLALDYALDEDFNNEAWGLDNVSVAADVNPAVDATPLPASLPLFATGLGAFGLIARRRNRAAV